MREVILVAVIAAVPGILAAIAGIIGAVKTNSGNNVLTEVQTLLHVHVNDHRAHRR